MIAKARFKKASPDGPKEFQIKETITVPMISLARKHAKTTRTFMKGGKVTGEPVIAQVLKKEGETFVPDFQGECCMVQDSDGVFLIPIGVLTWNMPVWDETGYHDQQKIAVDNIYGSKNFTGDEVTREIKETVDTIKNNPMMQKTILGFTVQQLIIISAVAFLVTKITK